MKKATFALIGLFAVAYILPLGVRLFIIPDETRYAEIPREMLASHDWIVPRLAGLRYFEKPVLGYWLNAVSMAAFGDNRFAARLPSALSVALTALMLWVLVRRSTGNRFTALLSAAAFLTCPMVFAFGVFNVLDNAFSLFLTAAMVSFFFAHTASGARAKTLFLVSFGASVALAFLTKGFLALALPGVAIAPFLVWERRWRGFYRYPWLPLVVAAAVALPWCIAVHLREPTFWRYFFWVEHIQRFASANAQHPEPFWFFFPHLAWAVAPWVVAIPAAILGAGKRGLPSPPVRFAWCWFLFPFLLFSCSRGKIPTYILPCLPPLVVLVAMGLTRYFDEGRRKAFVLGASLLAVVVGVSALILVLSQWTSLPGFRVYGGGESWKIFIIAGGLSVWLLLLAPAVRSQSVRRGVGYFCAAPVALMIGAHFMFPLEFEERKMPGRFLSSHADRVAANAIVVSEAELAVAACYYYKRTDVYVLEREGELAWGLDCGDSRGRFLDLSRLETLLAERPRDTACVLVLYRSHFEEYRDLLPEPAFEETFGRFVFVEL